VSIWAEEIPGPPRASLRVERNAEKRMGEAQNVTISTRERL